MELLSLFFFFIYYCIVQMRMFVLLQIFYVVYYGMIWKGIVWKWVYYFYCMFCIFFI